MVGGIRTIAHHNVVHRKEKIRSDSIVESVLYLAGIPLRSGVGEVLAEGRSVRETVVQPIGENLRRGAALASVEIEKVETSRDACLSEGQRRRGVEAGTPRTGQRRLV